MTYKQSNFTKSLFLSIVPIFLTFSCNTDINLDDLETAPIDDFHIGLPLVKGKVKFLDFLSEDQKDDINVDEDNNIYFEFSQDVEIASTSQIVTAFGGSSPESFFKVNFDKNFSSDVLIPSTGINFEIVKNISDCSSINCLPISNEIGDVTKLKFSKGALEVHFKGNVGGYLSLSLSATGIDGDETITSKSYVQDPSKFEVATLPLVDIWINNENKPELTIQYFDVNSTPQEAYINEIDMSDDNEIDELEIFFKDGKTADPVTIPYEEIQLDFLSDIFDENVEIKFKETEISLNLENPIGATGIVDMTDNAKTVNSDGSEMMLFFNDDAGKTQILNIEAASGFNTSYALYKKVYQSDQLLSARPTKATFTGKVHYVVPPGQSCQFSHDDKVVATIKGKAPLYIGFDNYISTNKTDVNLDAGINIIELKSAELRTEMNNEIPIGGEFIIHVLDEDDNISATINVDGNDNKKSILAATTDSDGENAQYTPNYLTTMLNMEQVDALLKATAVEISFVMKADGNPDTSELEPVRITYNQELEIISGIYINASINGTNSSK
ncbi:hypothetical protein [Flammeovirga pacifica]|uniref:Uncharacterized protein n=1 Tax=Flammeovirga pacifica TaxID=915059 RepID=A0A1S1YU31_FLAPC|nr:hypothetical protein [Flammeovirga pacifica]OHX64373.1 hypothetical protein NH26_22535 [Flammeovirga pacifica]